MPLRSRDTVDLGGASRASTVFGVMEEGLISSGVRNLRVPLHFGLRSQGPFRVGTGDGSAAISRIWLSSEKGLYFLISGWL